MCKCVCVCVNVGGVLEGKCEGGWCVKVVCEGGVEGKMLRWVVCCRVSSV